MRARPIVGIATLGLGVLAGTLMAAAQPAGRVYRIGATSTIPIVMLSVGDPVGSGLVASLSRPGGNVTGVSNVSRDVSGKLLQLLKEVRPDATRLAVLRNLTNPGSAPRWRETQEAADFLKIRLQLVAVRESKELESAFAAIARGRVAGVVILPDPLVHSGRPPADGRR
jgi:putative ABC transport system substrate-binding protein